MTEKRYYQDVTLKECKAKVVSSLYKNNQYHIILDQTIFYPESGGQLSDKGLINDLNVEYIYEENNKIYHIVNQDISGEVDLKLDWQHRYLGMQGHTAQHLVSAMVRKHCQGVTVSHHYGEIFSTIDVDQFDETKIEDIQNECNQFIKENRPVHILYPTKEELNAMPIHKKFEVEGQIRIVNIEGVEYNPCAGLHCDTLGQLQMVYIQGYQKIKQGYRISFICGDKLLHDYHIKDKVLISSGELLSKPVYLVDQGIEMILNQKKELESDIYHLKQQLIQYKANELPITNINQYLFAEKIYDDMNPKDVGQIIAHLTGKDIIGVIGVETKDSNHIFIFSKNINIKANELFKEIVANYNIKGGGNPQLAQGGSQDKIPFEDIIQQVKTKVLERGSHD